MKNKFLIRVFDTDADLVAYIECQKFDIEFQNNIFYLDYLLHGIWYHVNLCQWKLSYIKAESINGKN